MDENKIAEQLFADTHIFLELAEREISTIASTDADNLEFLISAFKSKTEELSRQFYSKPAIMEAE